MHKWLIIMLLLAAGPAFGQVSEEADEEDAERGRNPLLELQSKANRLLDTMQELGDWSTHYESIVTAMDSMYERNGWDNESDVFSMEMAREISAIPPWKPQERIDMFMQMVGDRYLLDESQLASLQRRIFEVNVGVFSRNADRIMEYATEAIQTRAAGEPFTPEQVARWVELAEPVMLDARSSFRKAAEEFKEDLDPEQRELLELDIKAGERRMDDVQIMAVKWKRGEWTARDWGMENDPIQRLGMSEEELEREARKAEGVELAEEAGDEGASEYADEDEAVVGAPETQAGAEETESSEKAEQAPDDAWARYIRAFIAKYKLNDAQQQRCWLLYRDAKARDAVFDRRFERQTSSLRLSGSETDNERVQARLEECIKEHEQDKNRIFDQLKRRLDRLPTRAQRKAAAIEEKEVKASREKAETEKAETEKAEEEKAAPDKP